MPSCREMADTDSPCRCKSKIITSSPSLITVPLLPPIGAASAMVRRLASPKRTLGTSGFIKTGEFSNAAFEENAPATHSWKAWKLQVDQLLRKLGQERSFHDEYT